MKTMACRDTGITYQTSQVTWHVCSTDYQNVVPITGHAEAQKFYYAIQLAAPRSQQSQDPEQGAYIINTKGVFYPLIPANSAWGRTNDGFVPFFVNDMLHWGGGGNTPPAPNCYNSSNNSAVLGRALTRGGFPKPGGGYQAHHIQPTSWGGDDSAANGVWLPAVDHYPFNSWWASRNFSL